MHTQRYKNKLLLIYHFLGRKVSIYMGLAVALGIIVFSVEALFALSLQQVLVFLGAVSKDLILLPSWVPRLNFQMFLIFFVFVGLARAGSQFLQSFIQSYVNTQIQILFRTRLLYLTMFNKTETAERISTLGMASGTAVGLFFNVQGLIFNLVLLSGLFLLLFQISFVGTIAISATLLLLLVPLRFLDRRIEKLGQRNIQIETQVDIKFGRASRNLLFMKIYNTQLLEFEETLVFIKSSLDQMRHFFIFSATKFVSPQIAGVLILAVIIHVAYSTATLSPGVVVGFLYIFVRAIQTVSQVMHNTSGIALYRLSVIDFFNWWIQNGYDSPCFQRKGELEELVNVKRYTEPVGWKFNQVSFRYPGGRNEIFTSYVLTIPPGNCAAVIGPSGIGKSTLIGLLLGQLTPTAGEIQIVLENQPAREYKSLNQVRANLLHSIGYVGPEAFMIEGTVAENLSYGHNGIYPECELKEALAMAECDFIFKMSDGLKHFLNEQGEGLSAGQKQRLALARALLRKPSALVLDEATSNLDAETESRLIETFRHLKGKMTLIIATHRMALLSLADNVVRLN